MGGRFMSNTSKSFRDKWHNNRLLGFSETLTEGSEIQSWILERNGFSSLKELEVFLKNKKRILDAGCGNGRVTALLRQLAPSTSHVTGIDLVSAEIAKANLSSLGLIGKVEILSQNLMDDIKDLGLYDFIYCQEVLHHTSNPYVAFSNLCDILSPDGEIAIYVYKKKAPIREFTDKYLSNLISKLEYNDAIKKCEQITRLGESLYNQNVVIHVPKVDILDIPEGEYELQRFLYHFFIKCFWNDALGFEASNVINYDWYHPQDSTHHTIDEVKQWFEQQHIKITREHIDHYGITIWGKK